LQMPSHIGHLLPELHPFPAVRGQARLQVPEKDLERIVLHAELRVGLQLRLEQPS
jgi:hypothetical protein